MAVNSVEKIPSGMMLMSKLEFLSDLEKRSEIEDAIYKHKVNARLYRRLGLFAQSKAQLEIIDSYKCLLRALCLNKKI